MEYHLFKKDKAWLRPLVPAKVQSLLRRRARAKYLVWDARHYQKWMAAHVAKRRSRYAAELEPGLLSIATPVWDGSPVRYLRVLAQSIAAQNAAGAVEWFLLDNGCANRELLAYMEDLRREHSWITVHRNAANEGIVGGLRTCLEHARNRYLCVADSDDVLYPDCLQIVQWWIRQSGYPALLYSDEDKVIGGQPVQPYFKPDFDPVLLLNSAYIAHLGVIERSKALELGAYTDRSVEGSPDWDCFVRFFAASYPAVHIPEVIYSWRIHPASTASEADSKPYIHHSQKSVLERYLSLKGLAETYRVRYSPLLPGSSDWWIERTHAQPIRAVWVGDRFDAADYPALTYLEPPSSLNSLINNLSPGVEMVALIQPGLTPEHPDFLWEAQGLLERYEDAVVVGGWIVGPDGSVEDGPLVPGFGGGCGCPDAGRPAVDPGYFTNLRKQRTVGAISSRMAVIRAEFLKQACEEGGLADANLWELGPLLGQFARSQGLRIVFSPFLKAVSTREVQAAMPVAFASHEPDRRYYPCPFGLKPETAYMLVSENEAD